MRLTTLSDKVRAAVDIYYQRYHFILKRIDAGQGDAVAAEVFGDPDKHLIRPMKGTGVFLAMLKGWLGADAAFCFDEFAEHLSRMGMDRPRRDERTSRAQLAALGAYFERNPAAVAVVTSSILYEADIVLSEVFRVLAREVAAWDIPSEKSRLIANRFAEYSRCYDAFITASDSSEIRLKPHRDLYSMALHAMGIPPESFHRVAGFEDSESGTIAIRASGIPLCCALPFPETEGHDFKAASYVARGGIPEVVLSKRVFLPDRLITE